MGPYARKEVVPRVPRDSGYILYQCRDSPKLQLLVQGCSHFPVKEMIFFFSLGGRSLDSDRGALRQRPEVCWHGKCLWKRVNGVASASRHGKSCILKCAGVNHMKHPAC